MLESVFHPCSHASGYVGKNLLEELMIVINIVGYELRVILVLRERERERMIRVRILMYIIYALACAFLYARLLRIDLNVHRVKKEKEKIDFENLC